MCCGHHFCTGICGDKNLFAQKQVYHFGIFKGENKLFVRCALKWSSFRRKYFIFPLIAYRERHLSRFEFHICMVDIIQFGFSKGPW